MVASPAEAGAARRVALCMISQGFVPTYGGAELRFRRYLPGLNARGIDTRLVTGTPKRKKLTPADREAPWYALRAGEPIPAEPLDGCPVHRVRLPDAVGLRRTWTLFDAAWRVCREARPDVVQIVGDLPRSTLPWLWRLRRTGATLVFATSVMGQPRRKARREWLRRLDTRLGMGALDCIVALNAPIRDELRALGVRTRIEVIPNGVDLERFRPPRGGAERGRRTSLGLGDDDRLLVSVGSVHPRKGTDLVLDAFARLAPRHPGLHLALAGPRRDLESPRLRDFRCRLESAAGRSGAAERIHFLGEIDDVDALLRAADLFVFPSRREGMPNAVLEAMASALPVVLSPFLGLSRDLGEDGEHYCLAPHDAPSIAAAVEALLEAPERGAALGAAARAWLTKTMDLRESLDRYAELYRELAG